MSKGEEKERGNTYIGRKEQKKVEEMRQLGVKVSLQVLATNTINICRPDKE